MKEKIVLFIAKLFRVKLQQQLLSSGYGLEKPCIDGVPIATYP
jgi:hypothetical protein